MEAKDQTIQMQFIVIYRIKCFLELFTFATGYVKSKLKKMNLSYVNLSIWLLKSTCINLILKEKK